LLRGRTWTLLLLGTGVVLLGLAVLLGYLLGARAFLYVTVGVTILTLFVGGIPMPVRSGPDEPTPEHLSDMQTRWFMNQVGRNITERQPKGSMRLLRPALLVGGPCMLGLLGVVVLLMVLGG